MEQSPALTAAEAAAVLGVTSQYMRALARDQKIAAERDAAGSWVFSEAAVREFAVNGRRGKDSSPVDAGVGSVSGEVQRLRAENACLRELLTRASVLGELLHRELATASTPTPGAAQ